MLKPLRKSRKKGKASRDEVKAEILKNEKEASTISRRQVILHSKDLLPEEPKEQEVVEQEQKMI